jgi:hypothetical protein
MSSISDPARSLSVFFRYSAYFMIFETFLHLTGIRMWGVETLWPADALAYGRFMTLLWGLASLWSVVLFLTMAKDILRYRPLIRMCVLLFVVHGMVLCIISGVWWGVRMPTIYQVQIHPAQCIFEALVLWWCAWWVYIRERVLPKEIHPQ